MKAMKNMNKSNRMMIKKAKKMMTWIYLMKWIILLSKAEDNKNKKKYKKN
jgi:hypothetical protein